MTARRYQHTRAKTPGTTRGDDWRESARCVGSEHIYDLAADHPNDERIVRAALTICAGCPVAEICSRELMGLEHGVVGGLTEYQRRDIRRGRRPRPLPSITPEPERPFACPACDFRSESQTGIARHWGSRHTPDTGRCFHGHEQTPGRPCKTCKSKRALDGYYARKKKDGAA